MKFLTISILSFLFLFSSIFLDNPNDFNNKELIIKNTIKLEYRKDENNFLIKNENNNDLIIKKQEILLEKYQNIVFIGDSRTVGLSQSIENKNIIFLAEVGKGLNWLKTLNISQYNNEDTLILINLGVNDLGNINEYINYLKGLNLKNFYYISVYPVDEYKESLNGYSVTNRDINNFNNLIKDNFNYIDINPLISKANLETRDGLHYTNSSYVEIFNFIKNYKI